MKSFRPARLRTLTALLAVVALLALLLVSAPVRSARAADPATSPEGTASQQANDSGQPVLVTADTTADTVVYANPDGTFTADISAGPVRVEDPNASGGWTPIDTSLQAADGAIAPQASTGDVSFSDGGAGPVASITTTDGSQVSVDWSGATLPAPRVEGDTATYANALPGIDLTLTAQPNGFEQSFIVNSKPSTPLVFNIPLSLDGLHAAVRDDGGISVTDDAGTVVMSADPAKMWGAALDSSGQPLVQAPVSMAIVETNGKQTVQVTPDSNFFDTPGLEYPVTVDPVVSMGVQVDTYVQSAYPTLSYGTDTNLVSGYSASLASVARSFIRFEPSGISGKHVTSATLKLWESFAPAACVSTILNVYGVSDVQGSDTWNTQSAIQSLYAVQSSRKGCSTTYPAGTVSITGGGTGGLSMTDWAQRAADGGPHAVEIRAASETDPNTWKLFNSSESGSHVPSVSVTYVTPDVPTFIGPQDGPAVVSTPQPALRAMYTDTNGDGGHVEFQLFDSTCSTLISSGTGTDVGPGLFSRWTPPTSVSLASGLQYGIVATAVDSWGGRSTASACSPFADLTKVDVVSPAPQSVSTNATPTLTAILAADAPTAAPISFAVHKMSDDTVVASGTGSIANPGATAAWNVPSGILQNGIAYYWIASAAGAVNSYPSSYFPVGSGAQVALTSPVDGAVLGTEEAPTQITAVPVGFDTVSRVEVYVDGALYATDTSAPFSVDWINPPNAGSHTVYAQAYGVRSGTAATTASSTNTVDWGAGAVAGEATAAIQPLPDIIDPTSSTDPTGSQAEQQYVDPSTIGDYAWNHTSNCNDWTNTTCDYFTNWNRAYVWFVNPYKHTGDDCTNFVSQSLYAGGWTNTATDHDDNWHWYYVRDGANEENSHSWSVAHDLAYYFTNSGRTVQMTSIKDGYKGDVIGITFPGYNPPFVNHLLVITNRYWWWNGSAWKLNYAVAGHTSNRRSFPFWPQDGQPDSVMQEIDAKYANGGGHSAAHFYLFHPYASY